MRIVCLCNNWLGWQVAKWLKEQGEELVAMIIHSPTSSKYGEELRSIANEANSLMIPGSALRNADTLARIRGAAPEIGVSVLFGHILRSDFLRLLPFGCVNLHPALLPYNRGAYPNVWSIVEKTPAGVTIHYIDEGIDTGDIIAQREVPVSATDTGESLYHKLELEGFELFKEIWPRVRAGDCPRRPQDHESAAFHKVSDVERIDQIDPQKSYIAEELINIIRARTFPPYRGAYLRKNGKKIYLRLELLDESEFSD